jgi:hypothetical protein
MITPVEYINIQDNVSDLDNVATVLRDLGLYWEAERTEQVADEYRAMVDRMRIEAANDN